MIDDDSKDINGDSWLRKVIVVLVFIGDPVFFNEYFVVNLCT